MYPTRPGGLTGRNPGDGQCGAASRGTAPGRGSLANRPIRSGPAGRPQQPVSPGPQAHFASRGRRAPRAQRPADLDPASAGKSASSGTTPASKRNAQPGRYAPTRSPAHADRSTERVLIISGAAHRGRCRKHEAETAAPPPPTIGRAVPGRSGCCPEDLLLPRPAGGAGPHPARRCTAALSRSAAVRPPLTGVRRRPGRRRRGDHGRPAQRRNHRRRARTRRSRSLGCHAAAVS